ncbi:MAG: hypothetical protein WBF33_05570 [Candidatus Nitrosopolaris sp.]|jgi:hypothetical protein
MNLNQIKIEHVISFSDALFVFSITFMALSIQTAAFSSNIPIPGANKKIRSITNTEYNSLMMMRAQSPLNLQEEMSSLGNGAPSPRQAYLL